MQHTPDTFPSDLKAGTPVEPTNHRAFRGPARPRSLKRTGFVLLLCVSSFAAGKLDINVPPGRENVFAASWTAWARLRQRDIQSGTTGADTIAMWKVVKNRFRDLDKSLNYK